MRRLFGCSVVGILCFGLTLVADPPKSDAPKQDPPKKDSFDDILKEMIGHINELGDQLAKVTDEKAAKESKKKLEETVAKMLALKERADKLKQNPEEAKKYDEKKLEEKYKAELEAAGKKFSTEIERLKGQPYGKEVLDALKSKEKKTEAATTAPKPPPPKKD